MSAWMERGKVKVDLVERGARAPDKRLELPDALVHLSNASRHRRLVLLLLILLLLIFLLVVLLPLLALLAHHDAHQPAAALPLCPDPVQPPLDVDQALQERAGVFALSRLGPLRVREVRLERGELGAEEGEPLGGVLDSFLRAASCVVAVVLVGVGGRWGGRVGVVCPACSMLLVGTGGWKGEDGCVRCRRSAFRKCRDAASCPTRLAVSSSSLSAPPAPLPRPPMRVGWSSSLDSPR